MNARNKGHAYERKIAKELKDFYPDCVTSRYGNRMMDDMGVDLINTDPFNVQCKAVERLGTYHDILKSMPEDNNYNLIFHKRNNRGEVVVMSKDDFYELLYMLKGII